ncbi:MAG: EAL domain-containing protein [Phycisphaerales bacterium]|nr:EAL domain-containing protein [Phycisphaerales bacterium]
MLTLWILPFGAIGVVLALAIAAFVLGPTSATGGMTHAAHSDGAHTLSHPDFFTNFGSYMARTGCLATAEGKPDWPWIIGLLVLNTGVVLAYLRIYFFWLRSYLAEDREDRHGKLMDLAQVFLWCAICGYAAGIVMFFWPAYRLTAICLFVLNIWSWRFACNLGSFRAAFSAKRYHRLAFTDALTGLDNRVAIEEGLSEHLASLADDEAVAVFFLDIDRFKLINDTLGHEAGDDLLRQFAERLRGTPRGEADAVVGRNGGDEFVIVRRGSGTEEEAIAVAHELLARFEQPFTLAGRSIRSTPSIGVTISKGERDATALIRDADIAMYAAKTAGKGRVRLFDAGMHAALQRRLTLEQDLAHAADRGEIHLLYQPIVDAESGRLEALEALARWTHPEFGPVSPEVFVAIAEETDLIQSLGLWVLREAARQVAEWGGRSPGMRDLHCHVNVSPKQLHDRQAVRRFAEVVREAGTDPSRITLEITESMFISRSERLSGIVEGLREQGFSIAIDDFGTGYSSIGALHAYPIDTLKIDRTFIRDAASRSDHAAVLHAMVTLADNLGMGVVAEGIERSDQLALLQALGCSMAQGYLFSEPLAADEVPIWIESWRARRAA